MKPTLLVFLSILFMFVSCGKSGSTQSVKLKVVSGAMFSSIPNAGGVLVVGRTLDDQNSFSKSIQSDNDVIDLPKGTWEFFAIAWEGSNGVAVNKNLTGVHRCAYSGLVKIDTEDTAVSFNMSQAACAQAVSDGSFVADPSMIVGNQFKNINFVDCSIIPGTLSSGSCSSTDKGLGKSLRIRYPDIVKINGERKIIGAGLVSRCIEESSYYSAYNFLNIPIGTGENGFIEFTIESFEASGCTGNIKGSRYSHNNLGIDRAQFFDNGSSQYLFFPHFNPYGSLGYDDSTFSGSVAFNTCHKLTIKLKDNAGNVISANQTLTTNIYSSTKVLFFADNSCVLGTGVGSLAFTIPQGNSSADIYFKSFSSALSIDANIYSLGIGFNYNKTTNTSPYSYGTLTPNHLKEIAEVASGNSSIMPAHTILGAGSVVVLRYDNIITKIQILNIDASSINFNAETFDYTTNSPIASISNAFLDSAMNEICDFTDSTCNIITYTGSDIGYHLIYNSINNLGVYLAGTDRSLFYLQ